MSISHDEGYNNMVEHRVQIPKGVQSERRAVPINLKMSLGKIDPVPLQIHFFIWLIY